MDFKALLQNKKVIAIGIAIALVIVAHFTGIDIGKAIESVKKMGDQVEQILQEPETQTVPVVDVGEKDTAEAVPAPTAP